MVTTLDQVETKVGTKMRAGETMIESGGIITPLGRKKKGEGYVWSSPRALKAQIF